MKRIRLEKTNPPAKRIRLEATREAATPKQRGKPTTLAEALAVIDDLTFQHEIDERLLNEAQTKLEAATFEIVTIQQGYRALVQKAEANTASRVRRMVEIEFSKQVESLTFQLREAEAERDRAKKHLDLQARGFYEDGPNHSCPECGCIIRPVPLVNGKAAKTKALRAV